MTLFRELAWIAVVLAFVTGAMAIIMSDRRWMLLMLAGEYISLTWLAATAMPIEIAIVKLVAGMMVSAIIAMSVMRSEYDPARANKEDLSSGVVFRVIAVLLIAATAWGLAARGWASLPSGMSRAAILGSMLLMSMGFLQLGISEDPFRVGLGLLTALAGFEILYAAVEPSLSVLALMASVNIGIAIIVSYMIIEEAAQRIGRSG